jgi:LacI family transcriptional regulator
LPFRAPVFQRGLVDGLITFSGLGNFNPMLTKLRKISRFADRPIISLLRAIPGCSAVLTDNAHGAYLATQHLIEHGHRHILHIVFPIGPNGFVESGHRVEGISMALQEHDLDPGEHLHLLPFMTDPLLPAGEPCNIATIRALAYDPATESHPVVAYLRAHPEVTAIETRNDAEALYLWALLTKAGFSIPEDISLIGFDDTDIMHDVDGENMLTSVNLRLHDVGRAAAELMLKHVNTHDTVDEQIIIPTTLSLRKSTAPARKRA